MTDKSDVKVSGKVLFGVDYLYFMRTMEIEDDDSKKGNMESVVDSVIRFFLLQWGFSVDEINKANQLFWEKIENKKLDSSLQPVLDRIVKFVQDDREKQERLVIEMIAVGSLDNNVTERELWFAEQMRDKFDLRPSEYQALISRGRDWATAVDYLGNSYIEFNKSH